MITVIEYISYIKYAIERHLGRVQIGSVWSFKLKDPINRKIPLKLTSLLSTHCNFLLLKVCFLSSNNTADPSYTKNFPASGDKKSDNLIPIIFRSLPSVISALTFSNYLRKNQMLYQFSHRSVNPQICHYVFLSSSLSISTQVSHSLHLSLCLSIFLFVHFNTGQSNFMSVCLSLYFRNWPFPHSSVNLYICLSIYLFFRFHTGQSMFTSVFLSSCLSCTRVSRLSL